MAANAASIEAAYQASAAPYQAQLNNLSAEYDLSRKRRAEENAQALQQLFIAKEQAQRVMPQQLAAQGIRGGLSETTRLGLNNNYINSRNTQDTAHLNALSDLELNYTKQKNTIQAQLAAARAQANAQLAALAQASAGGGSSRSRSGGSGGGGVTTYLTGDTRGTAPVSTPAFINMLKGYSNSNPGDTSYSLYSKWQ